MFVKASGPVVFSESSDSDENDNGVDDQTNKIVTEDIQFSKNSDSDTNDENCDNNDDEQPNKKKKMF